MSFVGHHDARDKWDRVSLCREIFKIKKSLSKD
jgi:hypothetical protein